VALEVLENQARDLSRPAMDLAGLLNNLERCGVPDFVEAARRLAPDNRSHSGPTDGGSHPGYRNSICG
jgi:hypothetical protein